MRYESKEWSIKEVSFSSNDLRQPNMANTQAG